MKPSILCLEPSASAAGKRRMTSVAFWLTQEDPSATMPGGVHGHGVPNGCIVSNCFMENLNLIWMINRCSPKNRTPPFHSKASCNVASRATRHPIFALTTSPSQVFTRKVETVLRGSVHLLSSLHFCLFFTGTRVYFPLAPGVN